MCKLWTIRQDLDNDVSMMLSAEHKEKDKYKYDILKLTFRNKNNGQQAKAIQLLSMMGEERPGRHEPPIRLGLTKEILLFPSCLYRRRHF